MTSPDPLPQNLQTANHYKQLHLGQKAIVFTICIMLWKIHENKIHVRQLINTSPALDALPASQQYDNILTSSLWLISPVKPKGGTLFMPGVSSTNHHSPILHIKSNGHPSSLKKQFHRPKGGTLFAQGVSFKEPHYASIVSHWITLEKKKFQHDENNSKKK